MKHFLYLSFFIAVIFSASPQNAPAWVDSFPYSPEFYTGIGSSNLGNRSDDYQRALAQARMNLAAEISTSISAETIIETEDRGNGNTRSAFYEKLNQSVEQNLKEWEIVDTWYSEKQGFWVYVRLNKNRWMQIQEEETSQLLQRIQQILKDDYFTPARTTADKFNLLATAAQVLVTSPYGMVLSGSIGGVYTGNINDFILSEIYRLGTSIEIDGKSQERETTLNKGAELIISCRSGENYPGKLPLKIENSLTGFLYSQTDINGTARIALGSDMLQTGANSIKIIIDFDRFGFPMENMYSKAFFRDETIREITVLSSRIFLSVESNKETTISTENSIRAIFSGENRIFEIADDRNSSDFSLIFTLTYSEFPQVLENAPLMAGLRGHISLRKDSTVLYEYETELFKDGGLTYSQANERVFRKMISRLSAEAPFIREIERVISE
ncbi:LPP20 family lipoprotein [Spirochaeta isovalerica]|uniref:DNA-binding transcriptional ArsR family regulator n=1 Tax=Spirochaeta isovalerica TaxID=150 RepID=A0A841R0Q3_9SPIO|nr:LPP20 family lipoprotein [Spirochaeta isovalerica]MBB6478524.1 DNA-binding transcriptional ArsR family regulator [Spirochaeta isovalerica]